MAKFKVSLMQKVWEECDVIVAADTPAQAEEKARHMALHDGVDWKVTEAEENSVEVLICEEQK